MVGCIEDPAVASDPDELPALDAAADIRDVPPDAARPPDLASILDGPVADVRVRDESFDLRPVDGAVDLRPIDAAPDLPLPDAAVDADECLRRLPTHTLTETPGAKSSPAVGLDIGWVTHFAWVDDGVVFATDALWDARALGAGGQVALDGLFPVWNSAEGVRLEVGAPVTDHAIRGRFDHGGAIAVDTPRGPAIARLDRLTFAVGEPVEGNFEAVAASGDALLYGDPAVDGLYVLEDGVTTQVCEFGCDRRRAVMAGDVVVWQALGQLHLRRSQVTSIVADAPRGTDVDVVLVRDEPVIAYTTPFGEPAGIYVHRPGAGRYRIVDGEANQPRLLVGGDQDCVIYVDDQVRYACANHACP